MTARPPTRLDDRYEWYQGLRKEAPVHRLPEWDVWIVSRYRDVSAALSDPGFEPDDEWSEPEASSDVSRAPSGSSSFAHRIAHMRRAGRGLLAHWMQGRSGVDHRRLRKVVGRAFDSRAVRELRPTIQSLTDSLLDVVAPRGRMDLMGDFAHPLPERVMGGLLGVPTADLPLLRRWTRSLMAIARHPPTPFDREQAAFATFALAEYFRPVAEGRASAPESPLVRYLRACQTDGTLTFDELLVSCFMIFLAGCETTPHLIGNTVHTLLRHPGSWQVIRADPDRIPSFLEESLRYEGPTQCIRKKASRETTVGGTRIPEGATVLFAVGSANRDPRAFDDPDRFDAERPRPDHLSFGHGPHFCLGAGLARTEAAIAIEELTRRFPDLILESADADWEQALYLRGLRSLPVRWS